MKKPLFAVAIFALTLCGCGTRETVKQEVKDPAEVVLENIAARRSVRTYTDAQVESGTIEKIVRAGMAAPSSRDQRPWEIIVLNEREALNALAEGLPYAKMLSEAPLAMVVCGDVTKSPQAWDHDCSAVAQNILLAAEALGLGAVWTAAFPYEDRLAAVSEVLSLPENIVPLCVIPMGYPTGDTAPKDKYDAAKVHYNKW